MSSSNTTYSVFSFIGFIFCVIPFTWHLKHRNTGTCLFMAWSGISCIYQFINSVVWNGNIVNWSPVWCDIGTRIFIGSSVGIPASSLCIFRHLHSISTAQGTMPTADNSVRRRRVIIDLALGLGLPLLAMILGYISQGHRYNILEDIGCTVAGYNSWVSIILDNIPPILIGLVTACYAVLTIRAFNRRRIEFNDVLAQHSNLSSNFYLRLMGFGCLEVLWTVPLASYYLYANIAGGLRPWISWDDVHSHFSNVWYFSSPPFDPTYELGRWVGVICAFNFFAFFGFAEEARENYRAAYLTVVKFMGLSSNSLDSPKHKTNDNGALVFARTITTTTTTLPMPDVENHATPAVENRQGDENELHVNMTPANQSGQPLNADVDNLCFYPIPLALPEPAVTK